MATHPGQAEILLDGNRLVVRGQLGPDDETRFANALFNYLRIRKEEWVLDFSELHHISSAYIGSTCLFIRVAQDGGRSVSILANERLADILRGAGVDKLAAIRSVASSRTPI